VTERRFHFIPGLLWRKYGYGWGESAGWRRQGGWGWADYSRNATYSVRTKSDVRISLKESTRFHGDVNATLAVLSERNALNHPSFTPVKVSIKI